MYPAAELQAKQMGALGEPRGGGAELGAEEDEGPAREDETREVEALDACELAK